LSQQINLYNEAFARKRDLSSLSGLATAWGIAALVVIVALLTTAVRTSNVRHNLMQESQVRDAAQTEMTRLASQLTARKSDPGLAAELVRLENGIASREEVMSTLHAGVIGDMQGFSEYLEAFARQSFSGLWLTGLKVASAGQDVVLEGRALRPELVPDYLQRLNREKVMQGHSFAELEMSRPDSKEANKWQARPNYVEFRLSTLITVASQDSQ
jgi:hypothetical protein